VLARCDSAHNFAIDSPINVTLQVINVGDAPASNLNLDDSWLSGFELSGPVGPWQWEELAPGASVVVSYFVTPTQQGPFESSPARITYGGSDSSSQQVRARAARGDGTGEGGEDERNGRVASNLFALVRL